jgi:hypothetical protein
MKNINMPDRLKRIVDDFSKKLKDIYQNDLISLTLYGSAVSGEFVDKHSNLNILVVLKNTDWEDLNKVAPIINKYKIINPLFLTEEYILSSSDIFPIEFLDMQENYFLLYGRDILKGIHVETRNLRFQCEQELKAKLINLRQLYLKVYKNNFALRNLLFKSLTSLLHILRNVLRLKGRPPTYLKQDIIKTTGLEFKINQESWERILAAKNKQVKLNAREVKQLFSELLKDLEKIVDIVDKS